MATDGVFNSGRPGRNSMQNLPNSMQDGVRDRGMKVGRDALREFQALLYPAASRAIRSYGIHWRYDVTEVDALDWPTILVALHQSGVVVPGPTRGRVSFWYLTWRFGRPDISDGLNDMLGASWAEAARYYLWRDAVRGPKVKVILGRWLRPMDGEDHARCPQVRYAFRLLDEPAPWRSGTSTGRRSGRGQIPLRWTSVPWLVPVDLEDRPYLPDHLQSTSTGASEADSEWISDTRAAALARSDGPSISRFLKALNAFKSDAPLPFAEAEQCIEVIKALREHLEHVLVPLIEASLRSYEKTGHAEFLAVAKGYLTSR